ncbi:uncharacterized protein [Amphiura filiformis]|uniref:uncharacterized protein n=1 Tax=Amphiura filiformis TaxID=82378 RepID=UPI003B21D926
MHCIAFKTNCLIFIFFVKLVFCNKAEAYICHMGQQPDPYGGPKLRWAMLYTTADEYCRCTQVALGGINIVPQPAESEHYFYTNEPWMFLNIDNVDELRALIHCNVSDRTGKASTTSQSDLQVTTENGRSNYTVVMDGRTRHEAREDCLNRGGDLAVIENQAENDLIVQLLPETQGRFWIGLSDIDTENTFIWVDGRNASTFTNFGYGEPNDHNSGEDCVEMSTSGKWNDKKCSSNRYYICEYVT